MNYSIAMKAESNLALTLDPLTDLVRKGPSHIHYEFGRFLPSLVYAKILSTKGLMGHDFVVL